jgi:translation initiation factor 5A precursor (eIF-5A)
MDLETYEVFDADIPEDLRDKIKEGAQVVYSDLDDRQGDKEPQVSLN